MSNFDSDDEAKESVKEDQAPLLHSRVPDYTSSRGRLTAVTQNIDKVAQKLQSIFKPSGRYIEDEEEPEQPKTNKPIISPARKEKLKSRVKYYIPVLQWLPKYPITNLKNDFLAGITVGVMLIPQSLAYASLIGVPAVYGLQTAFFPLLIYFFFGTSMQLSMGPEAVVSIITSSAIDNILSNSLDSGSFIDVDPSIITPQREALAIALAFTVGIFTLALGLFRFGFLASILSRPLLAGFINAIALEVILEQSDKFFSVSVDSHSYLKIPAIIESYNDWNWPTFGLGFGALAILIVLKIIKSKYSKRYIALRYIPDPLVVVLMGIVLVKSFNLEEHGVKILGEVKTGFLTPTFPITSLSTFTYVAPAAATIALIGVVESILVAKSYSTKYNYRVSQNRELVAMGLSNAIGSVFGIFPAFGSLTRSSVNDSAGAKTPVSTFFSSILSLLTILFLLPAFKYLPTVVMASIIVNAALSLVELHDLLFLWKVQSYKDLVLLLSTFLATLIFGVELGIALSVIVSLMLLIKETTLPHVAILKRDPETNKFLEYTLIRDINLFEDKHYFFSHDLNTDKGILIIRIEESLYFANIGQVKELFQKIEQRGNSPLHAIIFDASNIPNIDTNAVQVLIEMVEDWKKRNIVVCFVKLRNDNRVLFHKSGLYELIGIERFFSKRKDAINYILGITVEYSSYQ